MFQKIRGFLYGSTKPGKPAYKLTKIYNNNLDELEFNYNDEEIINQNILTNQNSTNYESTNERSIITTKPN